MAARKKEQKRKKECNLPKAVVMFAMIFMYAMLIWAVGYILTHNDPIKPGQIEGPSPAPRISINKKYQNERSEKSNCAGIMCSAVMSDDPSCSQKPNA